MSKIKITKSQVENDILNGFTRKELAEKYGVPQTQITALINALGLKGVRARKFMFEIVEEDEVITNEVVEEVEELSEESEVNDTTTMEIAETAPERTYNIID